MHVGLLVTDGCFSSALTAVIDVLSTAQAQRPDVDLSIPPVRVDVAGTGRKVTTGAGLTVPVTMHPRRSPYSAPAAGQPSHPPIGVHIGG